MKEIIDKLDFIKIKTLLLRKSQCQENKISHLLMLNERSHSEKATYSMIPNFKDKTRETVKRTVVAKSLKRRKG